MNKLISKIVGAFLGVTMATGIGVGVAVGSQDRSAEPAYAADGNTEYALINSTDDLEAGKSYIITSGKTTGSMAMAVTSNSDNRKATSITVTNNRIVRGASILSLTLGGNSTAWNFQTENYGGTNGYLYSASSGSNNKLYVGNTVGSTTISFSGDEAVINIGPHASRTKVRYNPNNGNPMFACYSSGQSPVYLWKEVSTVSLTSITSITGTVSAHLGDADWDYSNITVMGRLSSDPNSDVDVTAYVNLTSATAIPSATGEYTVSVTATSKASASVTKTNDEINGTVAIHPYDYTFTSKQYSSASSVTLSDSNYSPSWSLATDGGYFGYESDRGQQIGSGNSATSTATLTTSSFTKGIAKVVVYTAGKTGGEVSVTVGGKAFGGSAQAYGKTNEAYTFTKTGTSSFTGTIVISWANTEAALYIKQIQIEFEEASVTHVTSIDLGDDISIAKGLTADIVPTVTPGNATDQVILYVSDDETVATVDSTGKITAVGVGSAIITGTSHDNSSATDTVEVTVTKAVPKSLSWTSSMKNFEVDVALNTYFTVSQNILTPKYTDETQGSAVSISDSKISLKLGGTTISYDYVLTNADNEKTLSITYTEDGVSVSTGGKIYVSEPVSLGEVTKNFTGGQSYLLVDDTESSLDGTYTSLHGQPTFVVTSSNEDVIDTDSSYDTITYNSETKTGTFSIALFAYKAGTASIDISISYGEKQDSVEVGPIVVRDSAPSTEGSHYEKVTSTSDIEDGQYLFVLESGGVALNGALSTIDADNNTISVTPSNGKIEYTTTTRDAEFTIDVADRTAQTADSRYIYGATGSNALNTSTDSSSLPSTRTIAISSSNLQYVVGTSTFGVYRSSSGSTVNYRFRFAKSGSGFVTTGNGWYYPQLYKYVEAEVSGDFDKALEFVNTFMHTEVSLSDEGSGKCISQGWYTAAKAAFFNTSGSTATGYLQNKEQRTIVAEDFTDYYLRLQAWAEANGEVIELGTTDYEVSPLNAMSVFNVDNTAIATLVSVFAVLSFTTLGGYFLLRKKKEER